MRITIQEGKKKLYSLPPGIFGMRSCWVIQGEMKREIQEFLYKPVIRYYYCPAEDIRKPVGNFALRFGSTANAQQNLDNNVL